MQTGLKSTQFPSFCNELKESVIAKLIYTYRQYQNAFEKSNKDTEMKTTPGLIQPSIIPQPQNSHLNDI
jgi:hypothetical protein